MTNANKYLGIFTIIAGLSTLGATTAVASCFEEQVIEAHMICDSNDSNSADFTKGCTEVPETTIQVPIQCDERWYPASTPTITVGDVYTHGRHGAFCAKFGKEPADINGQTCASGRYRPTSGADWDQINYHYGTVGAANSGGYYFKTHSRLGGAWTNDTVITMFCSNNISSHDLNANGTGPHEYVVAFACK